MPARKRPPVGKPWTPDKVRERIKVALIAKKLGDHVLGTVEMTQTQVRAAEILLRKTMPDLSSTEMTGGLKIEHDITDEAMTPDEWEERYSESLGLGAAAGTTEKPH